MIGFSPSISEHCAEPPARRKYVHEMSIEERRAYWKALNQDRKERRKKEPGYTPSRVQEQREFKETWEQYKAKLPQEELAKLACTHTTQTKEYKNHYHKWRMANDEVYREYKAAQWRKAKRKLLNNKTPEFRKKRNAWKRAYLKANPDKAKMYRKKDSQNPKIKLIRNLRSRFRNWLAGNRKLHSVSKSVGMNMTDFKAYLESKFRPGMSWANYGHGKDKWVIDHIIPLVTAQWDQDKVMKLFHYTNMQPLWWHENQEKSDRLDWQLTEYKS